MSGVARLMMLGGLSLATGSISMMGCGGTGMEPLSTPKAVLETREDSAIDGADDRMDVYAHPDADLRDLAMRSVATMMHRRSAPTAADLYSSTTLGQFENLCTTERFWNDPILGSCTGTLIDDDLILTAGHCVSGRYDCDNKSWVFNYYRTSATTIGPISDADVFRCKEIVHLDTAPGSDHAIIRLDRPATPRFTPARVAYGNHAMMGGHPVAMIGSPSGTPLKIDAGGVMLSGTATDAPEASLDAFPGSSGSGVFSRDGYALTGVVYASGSPFYEANGTCRVAARQYYAHTQLHAMPAILRNLCLYTPGFQSQRLCFNLKGYVEGISSGNLTGWAFDRTHPTLPVGVLATFDKPIWDYDPSTVVASGTADISRADVNRWYGITTGHGFSIPVPAQFWDGQSHKVYVYATDTQPMGPIEELSGSPYTFTLP